MVYTMPLPAVVSAIGGLAAAGMNALSQRSANNRSWRQTKQLFGMQQVDRNSQNVYNSPSNQVAMLKAAGLSPASYYGGAAQNAGSAGVAQPGSPEVGATDFGAPISQVTDSLSNVALLATQKRNLESQIELNKASAIDRLYSGYNTNWELNQKKRLQATLDEQIRSDLAKTKEETANLSQQTQRLVYDLDLDKDIRDYRVALAKNESDKAKWEAFSEEWNGKVSQYQREYMDKHGRQVPSDAWSGVLDYILSKTGSSLPDLSFTSKSPIGWLIEQIKEHSSSPDSELPRIFDENGKLVDWKELVKLIPMYKAHPY